MWNKPSNQFDFQIHPDQFPSFQFPLSVYSGGTSQGWRGKTSASPFAFLLGVRVSLLGAKIVVQQVGTFYLHGSWVRWFLGAENLKAHRLQFRRGEWRQCGPTCTELEWPSLWSRHMWAPLPLPHSRLCQHPLYSITWKSQTILYSTHGVSGIVLVMEPKVCLFTWIISSLPREVNNWSYHWPLSLLPSKRIGCLSLVLTIIQSKGIHSLHILQIKYSWLWNEFSGFTVSEP